MKIAEFMTGIMVLASCQSQDRDRAEASQRGGDARLPAAPSLSRTSDPELAAAIMASRANEVDGTPCLAKPYARLSLTPAQHRRQREIQSDSHWLNRHVQERYSERLAFTGLDARGGRYRHLVALTGTRPIPPLKLGGRAADVPVIVSYNAPFSMQEIARRRGQGQEVARRLVPDLLGTGYAHQPDGGWIKMDVFSADGRPRADVLAHCDALRLAYRLPVLIEFINARWSVEPAPVRP